MAQFFDFYILHDPQNKLYRVKSRDKGCPRWSSTITANCFYDSYKRANQVRTIVIKELTKSGKIVPQLNIIKMRLKTIESP